MIFDLRTNHLLGTIAAQPDADGIIFDPVSGKVLVVSGDKGTLMSFNPALNFNDAQMDPPIDLGGAPEFLAADATGRVYINLMDKNEVAVVELATRKVVARWPVAPGGAPVGMAIDLAKHQLFIGCRNPQRLIVMSTKDGRVIGSLPIGGGVDAVKSEKHLNFASCRDGHLLISQETSPGKFEVVESVKTPVGAGTMGLDASTGEIYLPTAKFEEAKAGTQPSPKLGTFMIVVVSNREMN